MVAEINTSNKPFPVRDEASPLLNAPLLKNQPQIIHAFSTRRGGTSKPPFNTLNLSGKTGDDKINVNKNIEALKDYLSIKTPLFFLNQVHGKDVLVVDDIKNYGKPYSFDAIITSKKGVPLIILTADCLPILLFDPLKSVVAAVHAGWKGTSLQIVEKTVEKMADRFHCAREHIIAAMGPTIGPCCYEVDHPVIRAFEKIDSYTNKERESFIFPVKGKKERWMFDLAEANRLQLLNVGLIQDNICQLKHCTCCQHELFYSYRRDGKHSGRQGAVIMIKEDNFSEK